jgi:hypothetical protein
MRMSVWKVHVFAASCVVVALTVVLMSCSLGLDESRVTNEAAPTFSNLGPAETDGSTSEAEALQRAVRLGEVPCETNFDCVAGDACLSGTCEVQRKRCVFDVCRPNRCESSVCDRERRTCTGASRMHSFVATRFGLGAELACRRCVAASYPWLFVVTTTGAFALDVSDPANPSPPKVPIVGLGFVPWAITVSDHRLWMLGAASGSGPSRIQLAVADIPAHPFVPEIPASTVLATYDRPASSLQLFGLGEGRALLLDQEDERSASPLEGLLDERTPLRSSVLPTASFFEPSSARGRILLLSSVVDRIASFVIVTDAGTRVPRAGGLMRMANVGEVSEERSFAQAPDGSVLWLTPMTGIGIVTSTRAFVLRPTEGGSMDVSAGVDVETYDAILQDGSPVLALAGASAAFVDEDTAMVVSRAAESGRQTAVGFVRKVGPEVMRDPAGALLRDRLLFPVSAVLATAGSHGVGYVVAADPAGRPKESTVYAFDPGCAR